MATAKGKGHSPKQMYLILILLVIVVTLWVFKTEEGIFSDSNERPVPIEIVTSSSNDETIIQNNPNQAPIMHGNARNIKRRPPRHSLKSAAELRAISEKRFQAEQQKINPEGLSFGIDTAPYDMTELHIYGEDEFCNNDKYKNQIRYMDVTGMYDTGTNTFYQVLTKNCWGRETRMIDYITSNPPQDATEKEKEEFQKKTKEYYESERPKVLDQVPVFMNVKWKPLTGNI